MEIENIGVIGTGDMGEKYAKLYAARGHQVYCCDLPENRARLEQKVGGISGIKILDDGIAVSRVSDLVFYLTPVENTAEAVARYGTSTKGGAIVSAGTSVMTPVVKAFDHYLPTDVNIVNWHWLFGPGIPEEDLPKQSSAVVNHRSHGNAYQAAIDAFESLKGPKIVELPSYQEHDRITADTQAVTQTGFLSMVRTWKNRGSFPWENPTYIGGIDNVKILMGLRILSGKPHVYAGLAILNPYAPEQIRQYSKSVYELFSLMVQERESEFRERLTRAREFILGNGYTPILLDDRVMGEFGLGTIPQQNRSPNSHLSLLAKFDSWHRLQVNPYRNLICQTPVFKLLLGIAEYLFRNDELLEESMRTALFNKGIREDDLEFVGTVRDWTTIIGNGDIVGYKGHFEDTQTFFKDRLTEGMKRSGDLIKRLG